MPTTYAELEKMRSQKAKNSPEFRTVSRNNKLVQNHYLQTKSGADGRYSPKFSFIQTDVARHLTIYPATKTHEIKSPI